MSQLNRALTNLAHHTDQTFDRITRRIKRRRKIVIIPYRWYGHADQLVVRGRVRRVNAAITNTTFEKQLLNFATDEVPGAHLRVTYLRTFVDVATDEEGYFTATIPLEHTVKPGWHGVQITLIHPTQFPPLKVMAHCLVPPDTADYGIISDIDDTILLTDATSPLRTGINTFLATPRERKTFPDVVERYQKWQMGDTGNVNNPIFYVSSSPWNIYSYLTEFIEHNHIPAGPLCLRDIGFDEGKLFAEDHTKHKSAHIAAILNTYPTLPFILVGDNGQDDPHIYADIAQRFPGRIRAIWIRDTEDDILREVAV